MLFLWLLCYYCLTTGIDSNYVLEELIKGRISGLAGAAFYFISDETSEDCIAPCRSGIPDSLYLFLYLFQSILSFSWIPDEKTG